MTTIEEWRPIAGHEGYEVSSLGRVRDPDRRIKAQSPTGKYANVGRGYLATRINRRLLKVHRLVAIAFIPNPGNLPEINHKSGITILNAVDDLEWSTSSHNQLHAIATGLKVPLRGEKVGTCRYSETEIVGARALSKRGFGRNAISRATGISRTHVTRILNKQSWAHLP